jgi:uroporphyrinogen-III synthase
MLQILITRPALQAQDWVAQLQAHGVSAQALPLVAIHPPPDPQAVQQCWATLAGVQLVVFVSPNAVLHFFAQPTSAWPTQTYAASSGPGTTQALRACGVPERCILAPAPDAPQLDSEALWQVVRQHAWQGARVLLVRAAQGREWLADQLRAQGACVTAVVAYQRGLPVLSAAQQTLVQLAQQHPRQYLWFFSSSEAITNLQQLAPHAPWPQARALVTHPRIADTARAVGLLAVDCVLPSLASVLAYLQSTPS